MVVRRNRNGFLPALALAGGLLEKRESMATEEPKYRVEAEHSTFQVRVYEPTVLAETVVESEFGPGGNEGFRRLAAYIFGGNDGGKKIAMTAPVAQTRRAGARIPMTAPVSQERRGEGWVVSFTMPAGYTMDSLPAPNDSRVTFRQIPGRRVAAVRFSGTWGVGKFEEKANALLEQVKAGGLKAKGEPVFARYDPPWTPWFVRRNEVLVELGQ